MLAIAIDDEFQGCGEFSEGLAFCSRTHLKDVPDKIVSWAVWWSWIAYSIFSGVKTKSLGDGLHSREHVVRDKVLIGARNPDHEIEHNFVYFWIIYPKHTGVWARLQSLVWVRKSHRWILSPIYTAPSIYIYMYSYVLFPAEAATSL